MWGVGSGCGCGVFFLYFVLSPIASADRYRDGWKVHGKLDVLHNNSSFASAASKISFEDYG